MKHQKIKISILYLILGYFLIWRTGLFLTAWLGSYFMKFNPTFPYADIFLQPSGLPVWVWSFANFDGVHYLTISLSGYSSQFTQVFFPLYPILITLIHRLLPFIHTIVIGLSISNISFLASLLLFWKLLCLDYKKETIVWILPFLIFFPTSFFFGSIYTESLFLLFMLVSFYSARKGKWWLAGFSGGLASATKLIGIYLLPALLWEWYTTRKSNNQSLPMQVSKRRLFLFSILRSPILYLIPAGFFAYLYYLQINLGDALFFWHAQPIFGAERSGGTLILLPQVLIRYLKIFLTVSPKNQIFWISFSEVFFTMIALYTLLVSHLKKVRFSYLIFSWLSFITPSLTGTLSSMPRYVLVILPIFIMLGMINSRRTKILLLSFSILLLIIFTYIFTRGQWIA